MKHFLIVGFDKEDALLEVREHIEAPNLKSAYEIANKMNITVDDIIELNIVDK
jgi:hypothetical protein